MPQSFHTQTPTIHLPNLLHFGLESTLQNFVANREKNTSLKLSLHQNFSYNFTS